MIRDEDTLKLHTDVDGTIWYADGNREPLRSGLDAQQFLARLEQHSKLNLRVLGLTENSRLIARLLARSDRDWRVELAGPVALETIAERRDPRVTLYRMRQLRLAPSLGGWHAATDADLKAYMLVEAVTTGQPYDVLVTQHPAWHDVTFLPTPDADACASMLGHLIDPRWFIDPLKPERLSQATSYMGLIPKVMTDVFTGNVKPNSGSHQRCAAVFHAWWRPGQPNPEPADMERPNHFIWRNYRANGHGPKGALRASQKFLDYVLRTWLQQILCLSPGHRQQELFSPDAMLQALEVKAYREHAATRKY